MSEFLYFQEENYSLQFIKLVICTLNSQFMLKTAYFSFAATHALNLHYWLDSKRAWVSDVFNIFLLCYSATGVTVLHYAISSLICRICGRGSKLIWSHLMLVDIKLTNVYRKIHKMIRMFRKFYCLEYLEWKRKRERKFHSSEWLELNV